jgi:hypothetical protein
MSDVLNARIDSLVAVATDVFQGLYEQSGPFGVAAMILHTDGDGIEIALCTDDELVGQRTEALLELSPDAAAVVFVTARVGEPTATRADVARYELARLCAQENGFGTQVLDWLIIGDGPAVSIALNHGP